MGQGKFLIYKVLLGNKQTKKNIKMLIILKKIFFKEHCSDSYKKNNILQQTNQ